MFESCLFNFVSALPNGSPNYNNATALIVTFPVNNHVQDEDNQLAKIWEAAFLDYIKGISHELNHTHVTYMAEVRAGEELAKV